MPRAAKTTRKSDLCHTNRVAQAARDGRPMRTHTLPPVYFDEDEPVFRRSKWGTSNYEYNPRNPVGCALTVISVLVAGVVMLLMYHHAGPFAHPSDPTPTWSEPEDGLPIIPPPHAATGDPVFSGAPSDP